MLKNSEVKNFGELCQQHSKKFDIDKNNNMMYEYACKYSLLGLCVTDMQFGNITDVDLYENHYDFMTKNHNTNQKNDYKCEMYEKAFISGYIEKDKGIKMYEKMKRKSKLCCVNIMYKK